MALLRAATFNLLHGMSPRDGGVDTDLLRESVGTLDADVLGIQEVDRCQPRTGGIDQTAVAAEVLGAAWWWFAPSLHGVPDEDPHWVAATEDDGARTVGPTYGIGLISRLPVRQWWVKRFPPAPFRLPLLVPADGRPRLMVVPDEPRLALAALVDGPAGRFTVVTAHLSFVPGWNVRQARAIARWAAQLPQPALFMGDFNLPGTLPGRVTGWTELAAGATYPSYAPKVQLDHVLARGLTSEAVVDQRVWTLPVSDHCALSVDLDL
jgi:endonuclease/exonuclease/phosphatase family metal-dependent hydrolase